MLVLSRNPGQTIELRHKQTGEVIVITCVGRYRARLGFDADRVWDICRCGPTAPADVDADAEPAKLSRTAS